MSDISLVDAVLSSGQVMLPFLLIVSCVKGWIVPLHAFRADQAGLLMMAEKLEQGHFGQLIDMRQKPACCPYCGRYGDLGSCVGCGAPTAPVRLQTRRIGPPRLPANYRERDPGRLVRAERP